MVKLRHCGILVHNLELSVKLYTNIFGFEEINRGVVEGKFAEELFNLSPFSVTYVKLKAKGSNVRLELWKIKDFLPVDNSGLSHIALTVDNLDEIYKQLMERKLKFFSPPIKAKDSRVRLCFCRDYDGNILELVEEPKKSIRNTSSIKT